MARWLQRKFTGSTRTKNADGEPVFSYVQGYFARKYPDGSFSLHGRSDDVINVSGHRIGTEEIEGAILKDKQVNPEPKIGNCIVIGAPHRDKGLTPLAFVLPVKNQSLNLDDELGDTSTLRNPECLEEIRTAVARWSAGEDLAEQQVIVETTRTLRVEYAPVGERNGQLLRVATITIDNPPVNALSERLLDELETTLPHIERRTDIGAAVIAGRGSRSFVAGADVRQLLEDVHDLSTARALPSKAHSVTRLIEAMDKPVIAAIEGVALGGGCELAMACHWRVGNERTSLQPPGPTGYHY